MPAREWCSQEEILTYKAMQGKIVRQQLPLLSSKSSYMFAEVSVAVRRKQMQYQGIIVVDIIVSKY